MAENTSLVSIIIPVYNCELYLAEAIESVSAQPYRPLEVIVVDDGSTDGSADVAKGFAPPVRYCHQPQSGIGAARNRGTELARGSFLAFLDADDRWAEDKMTLQMEALRRDPGLDAVFGHVRQLHHGPRWDQGVRERACSPAELMPGYVPGTMLIRRDAFDRVGPFKTDCRVGEFIDWYLRATELGLSMRMLPDLVHWRRIHETNQGVRQRKAVTDYVSILKASLDRRRAANRQSADHGRTRGGGLTRD